jgi:hypothetical protein
MNVKIPLLIKRVKYASAYKKLASYQQVKYMK